MVVLDICIRHAQKERRRSEDIRPAHQNMDPCRCQRFTETTWHRRESIGDAPACTNGPDIGMSPLVDDLVTTSAPPYTGVEQNYPTPPRRHAQKPQERILPADGATCTDPAHFRVMDEEVTTSDDRQIRQNARPLHTHKLGEEGAKLETAVLTCWTNRTQCSRTACPPLRMKNQKQTTRDEAQTELNS